MTSHLTDGQWPRILFAFAGRCLGSVMAGLPLMSKHPCGFRDFWRQALGTADKRSVCPGFLSLLLLFVLSSVAHAHQAGESYIYIQVHKDHISGRYEVPLRDLDLIFALDQDLNGEITPAEFIAQKDKIHAFFEPKIRFEIDGQYLPIRFVDYDFLVHPEFTFSLNRFEINWSGEVPDNITVEHQSSFNDVDDAHRVLFLIESNVKTGMKENEAQYLAVFDAGLQRAQVSLTKATTSQALGDFFRKGVRHVLGHPPYLALFLAFTLGSVLVAQGGSWVPHRDFGQAANRAFALFLCYALAHCALFWGATLIGMTAPRGLVAILVTATFGAVAMGNLMIMGWSWVYTAAIGAGIVHGIAFAGAFAGLPFEQVNLLASLIGFNVGVEIAQIAVVIPVFIALALLRRRAFYVPVFFKGGSAALACISAYWVLLHVVSYFSQHV